MAILKIARMGHPLLRKPAAAVEDPGATEVRLLVADMIATMEDSGGTGLAAPQVHVPRRIVVFFVDDSRGGPGEGGQGVPLTVLVNPQIEILNRTLVTGWEACLSVPGLAGQVPRYRAIRYRGLTLDGDELVRDAYGYHARVVQHECDHLDGVLYPQRMTDLSRLVFTSEMKYHAEAPPPEE